MTEQILDQAKVEGNWRMKHFLLRTWKVPIWITLGLIIGAVSVAAAQEAQIHACVSQDGSPRIVVSPNECRHNETYLTWNITGPAGPQGEPGPAGSDGVNGLNCWEAIGDINGDGSIDIGDCIGPQGP